MTKLYALQFYATKKPWKLWFSGHTIYAKRRLRYFTKKYFKVKMLINLFSKQKITLFKDICRRLQKINCNLSINTITY